MRDVEWQQFNVVYCLASDVVSTLLSCLTETDYSLVYLVVLNHPAYCSATDVELECVLH